MKLRAFVFFEQKQKGVGPTCAKQAYLFRPEKCETDSLLFLFVSSTRDTTSSNTWHQRSTSRSWETSNTASSPPTSPCSSATEPNSRSWRARTSSIGPGRITGRLFLFTSQKRGRKWLLFQFNNERRSHRWPDQGWAVWTDLQTRCISEEFWDTDTRLSLFQVNTCEFASGQQKKNMIYEVSLKKKKGFRQPRGKNRNHGSFSESVQEITTSSTISVPESTHRLRCGCVDAHLIFLFVFFFPLWAPLNSRKIPGLTQNKKTPGTCKHNILRWKVLKPEGQTTGWIWCAQLFGILMYFFTHSKVALVLSTFAHHRKLVKAIAMTACDLCASYKTWDDQLANVNVIFAEFYAQVLQK